MKRFFLFLVSALLICAMAAGLAEEARPGNEVTVTLRLENTNAAFVRVLADYDGDAFELVGYTAADGEAGSRTEKAIREFQTRYALEQDGICGAETWTALLGGEKHT